MEGTAEGIAKLAILVVLMMALPALGNRAFSGRDRAASKGLCPDGRR